jgi:hypothetical protein
MPRTTTEEVDIAGQRLPKGAILLLMFGSANRDEVHGIRPDVFDIRRQPIDHLGLGRGIHYCMGAPLARLEARIALETLSQDPAISGDLLSAVISTRYILGFRKDNPNVFNMLVQGLPIASGIKCICY